MAALDNILKEWLEDQKSGDAALGISDQDEQGRLAQGQAIINALANNWTSDPRTARQTGGQNPMSGMAYHFINEVPWERLPEGARVGMMEGVAGVPSGIASRILASMAFAKNWPNAKAPYETFLPPPLEAAFRQWLGGGPTKFDPSFPFPDYDMRAWWQAMQANDPKATYKVKAPNEPGGNPRVFFPNTFSTPYSVDFDEAPSTNIWKKQR